MCLYFYGWRKKHLKKERNEMENFKLLWRSFKDEVIVVYCKRCGHVFGYDCNHELNARFKPNYESQFEVVCPFCNKTEEANS